MVDGQTDWRTHGQTKQRLIISDMACTEAITLTSGAN